MLPNSPSNKYSAMRSLLADPEGARGCFTNISVIDSFINYFIEQTFSPSQLYGAAKPKHLEIALPVIK